MKHLKIFDNFNLSGEYIQLNINTNDYLNFLNNLLENRLKEINNFYNPLIIKKLEQYGFDTFVNTTTEEGYFYIKSKKRVIEQDLGSEFQKFMKLGHLKDYESYVYVVLTIYELHDEYFLIEWISGNPGETSRSIFKCDQRDGILKLLDDKLSLFNIQSH